MEGLVLKSTGSWYEVLANDISYTCRTRGKLRLKGFKTTNPIAVGDRVVFELEDGEEQQGVITEILPRENYIIRKSIKKTGHGHILAANIDQAVLVATLVFPRTSLGFIDRFLVAAESFRIPQVIIFNKIDILGDEERQIQQEIIAKYESLGIKCFEVSAKDETGITSVKNQLQGKMSLISGHSGVGKSTFLNLLAPHIEQSVKEVSDYAEKGVHTTTFAEMFIVENETFVIDTPGIKELGLIDIEKEELSDYFPEMREISDQCKFNNCTHTHEPKCAIQDAVDEGLIHETRYMSYLSMFYEEDSHR
ncbi:ribosome small subunit-dependent GTPase A [Fulvivirga sp. RKSG066]|uniref:ribosome small subunit-dependent GTPase A n=1 Tax=Fulvivirga aurantia TaxID=2529383 RepID=UPI0012BBA914|nr:ribosome small subunit-dependent GTPase A [Fulvivirga aurantia]MTI22274.1 ribosome small subunit-dependent GTPase A [Fulvivirga aurantia]